MESKMKTCEFKIEGMTCDHCAVSIQNKLVENNGIYKSIARFEKSNAIVFFDESVIDVKRSAKLGS
ncbi:heavy-metal-associated domain-containing protein [Aliarcobacter butzleri]|uniref:heavy-metal-associated domain-containing protein n=2 Tax=Aliarcobacter butzleri TaxID=28197 RepID=UPI003AF3C2E4